MRLAAWLVVLLLGAPAWAQPSWHFAARFPAERTEPVAVEATLSGDSGPVQLCTSRDGFGRYIRDVTVGGRRVSPDDDDSDCWSFRASKRAPLRVSYRVDLSAEAQDSQDPDRAALVDGTFLFEEDAIVLSPAPRPSGDYTVEFRLPAGIEVETPWERLSPNRFRTSWAQYQTGSYVAVGRLQRLGEVPVRSGVFALTLIGATGRATTEILRSWVSRAGARVANFYQGLLAPRVETLLVPEDCADQGGIFGTTLHDGRPSVVLFFCADAPAEAFADDWLATHELFHVGNPSLQHRLPWFTEGAATYYQDVLRARSGERPAAKMWGDLYDGFRRFCSPVDGLSLQQESDSLRQRHRYQRVYWGAACLFFQLDVAIRRTSHGKESLDTVMRVLLRRSRVAPLSAREVITALDGAAGAPLATQGLTTKDAVDLTPLYRALGIEPVGDEAVNLHDDGPLAGLRKHIFIQEP